MIQSDLDAVGFDYQEDLGDPGEYPFTRSLHPQGYRSTGLDNPAVYGFRYARGNQPAI